MRAGATNPMIPSSVPRRLTQRAMYSVDMRLYIPLQPMQHDSALMPFDQTSLPEFAGGTQLTIEEP